MSRMSDRIPLLDLQAQHAPIRDELVTAMTRVCDSQRFIMGPEIEAFEREIAQILGLPHAVALSSGTDAVLAALMALGIGAGDEVVTTTYSFFATAGCIVRVGAKPVLVDIDPATYNIDTSKLSRAITPRTKAIMPVHLFGLCADMNAVTDVAARAKVPVIEDAAQAIGATFDGQPAGGFGVIGCFSFFPSKNLGALGDAGLVTTRDAAMAERLRLIRNHGMAPKYYHHIVGGNFRMDAIQAAVLRVKAPHLDRWTNGRRANAAGYRKLFAEAGASDRVALPTEPAGSRHIYNQFVIRVDDRDGLKRHLDERGIGNEIYYPVQFHLQPCFSNLGYHQGDFPHAERAAAESLAIPIYAELTEAQQARVVEEVASYVDVVSRGAGVI